MATRTSSRRPRRTRTRTRTTLISLVVAVVIVIIGVASGDLLTQGEPSVGAQHSSPGAQSDTIPSSSPEPVAEPGTVDSVAPIIVGDPGSALELLATLPVKGKAPMTGYDREGEYGRPWADVDANRCDTRNDILTRDLTDIVTASDCKVLSGTLLDPYTITSIDFVRGTATSSVIHIDHVVALANTWVTGAQQLTAEQRLALANDPLNLIAVDGTANLKKGAGDAATWLPPAKSSRCAYVARQISVKAAYSLWVAAAEKEAMTRVLDSCPDQPAVASADATLVAGLAPVA